MIPVIISLIHIGRSKLVSQNEGRRETNLFCLVLFLSTELLRAFKWRNSWMCSKESFAVAGQLQTGV